MLKVINYNYHRTNPNIDIHKKDGSLRVYIINKKEYYLFGVLMYTTILYDRCCSIVSNLSISVTNINQLSLFLAFVLKKSSAVIILRDNMSGALTRTP
jgi:hypothetical protein